MNYQETLDYLFHALPAYHRVGAAAYKANLDNTKAMMHYLHHPEQGFRSIHVAGTNGKGSVSHFLASILHRAGLKVGLYTSPHLVDFRERIRINGEMIPQDKVVSFIEQHRPFLESKELSFFEMTVGLAFDYFRNEHVDIGNHRFIVISLNSANKKLIDRVSIIPIPKQENKTVHGGQP